MKKVAIVLMNLGGPDKLESVEPFLFNLFYDKAIINLPNPLRWLIATIISKRRKTPSSELYSLMGGKSPILEETTAQMNALNALLKNKTNHDFKLFIHMRYWHPLAKDVAAQIREFDPEEVLLVPLYPHFSTTTTNSSINNLKDALNGEYRTKTLCCYYDDPEFIRAHASVIRDKVQKPEDYQFLFSAHGIPEKLVTQGDPYKWQIEKTVELVAKELDLKDNFLLTFQSRVGPLKWLDPYTDVEIEKFAKAGKKLVIVPIAFVSEHIETLVELDIEYKKLAEDNNCPEYIRIPTLSVNEHYINSLAQNIRAILEKDVYCASSSSKICPEIYKNCYCRNQER